jgi:hypothetical protein
MKKSLVLIVVLVLGLVFTNSGLRADDPCDVGKFSLSVGAGMRVVADDLFKDVYGTSGISINVDFGVKVMKSLEVFLHTDYFTIDGELTYTGEDTTLTIIPAELGARYLIPINKECKTKLFPYFGVGVGYYMVKEENVIDTFEQNKVGFFAEGGLRFYFAGSIFADLKLKNVFLKVENDQGDSVEAGGLAYMFGVGISF